MHRPRAHSLPLVAGLLCLSSPLAAQASSRGKPGAKTPADATATAAPAANPADSRSEERRVGKEC